MSLGYAGASGLVFVCLALPGRQYPATMVQDQGKACRPGFDSHFAPGAEELVFFKSSQLLPLYLVGSTQMTAAVAAANRAIETIAKVSGNTGAKGPYLPSASQLREWGVSGQSGHGRGAGAGLAGMLPGMPAMMPGGMMPGGVPGASHHHHSWGAGNRLGD